MGRTAFDHCVIAVSDWDRANVFYGAVLGAEVVARGAGFACRFGGQQLNVHGPGVGAVPLARLPVRPGESDLGLVWDSTLDEAQAHLADHGVPVELGPVSRHDAQGPGHSLYLRDPDGLLIELIACP